MNVYKNQYNHVIFINVLRVNMNCETFEKECLFFEVIRISLDGFK